MTIGLAMLVKDAEETLPATLASALPVIDCFTIIDTGSTDGTVGIIEDMECEGMMLRRPFQGFGPSRTELLEAARPYADFTLMLDADHKLHVEGDKPDLAADCYRLRVRGPLEWRLPLLTRSEHPFEYRGAAHAFLHSDAPTRSESTDWLSIDGGAGATREKLERDRVLLEEEFLQHPDDARTAFYLAQTYRDLDLIPEAIRMYRLRAAMDGWDEENYVARYELGILLSEHVAFSQGADVLLAAWRQRPSRMEALRALANAANAVADKTPKPDDLLFVRPGAYKEER